MPRGAAFSSIVPPTTIYSDDPWSLRRTGSSELDRDTVADSISSRIPRPRRADGSGRPLSPERRSPMPRRIPRSRIVPPSDPVGPWSLRRTPDDDFGPTSPELSGRSSHIHYTKRELQNKLACIPGFSRSRHYVRYNGRSLYFYYSRRLLTTLLNCYTKENIPFAHAEGKYLLSDHDVKKMKNSPSEKDYNDLRANNQKAIFSVQFPTLRIDEFKPPDQYHDALLYLLQNVLPEEYYNNCRQLKVLNVGVGNRDILDSAILFRCFPSLYYVSVDPDIPVEHRRIHPCLDIRGDGHKFYSTGVEALRQSNFFDLAIMVHPNPAFSFSPINFMLEESINKLKPGGVLLVTIRGDENEAGVDEYLLAYSRVSPSVKGTVNFRCEGNKERCDFMYGRDDTYYVITKNAEYSLENTGSLPIEERRTPRTPQPRPGAVIPPYTW